MQLLSSENYLDDDDYLHECYFFCFVTNNDTSLKRNINESIKDIKITKKQTLTKSFKKGTSRYCEAYECEKYPSFNYLNKITPIYCSKHKLNNMVNVRAKQCAENNCTTSPSFNFSTKNEPIYCYEHKHDDMVNIKMFQCSKYSTKKCHKK